MYYQTLIAPGVFEIKKDPISKEFYLDQKEYSYKVPPKLYGNMQNYVDFYWKSFERTKFVGGLMLTGQKGSGKTMIAATLCNMAIARGLRVVEITNTTFSTDLLRFIDDLDKVVLFFDEFGKNFNTQQQDKMLTLLSNISGKERLIFITENVPQRISEFIRNRPGRVKYSMHFNKLPMKVVEEYCKEFNVNEDFYKEFLSAYKSIITFQFDHLIAVVDEHLNNPMMEFDELVEMLNIDGLTGTKTLVFVSCWNIDTGDVMNVTNSSPETMTLNLLEARGMFYLSVAPIPKEADKTQQPFGGGGVGLQLGKGYIKEMTDDTVIFESKGIRVIYKIERV